MVSFLSNNTHTTIHDTNKCNGSYFLVYEVFVPNNNKYFQKLRFKLKINSKNTSTLLAEVSYFFTVRILITFLNNLLFLVTDQKSWNLFHDVIHWIKNKFSQVFSKIWFAAQTSAFNNWIFKIHKKWKIKLLYKDSIIGTFV